MYWTLCNTPSKLCGTWVRFHWLYRKPLVISCLTLWTPLSKVEKYWRITAQLWLPSLSFPKMVSVPSLTSVSSGQAPLASSESSLKDWSARRLFAHTFWKIETMSSLNFFPFRNASALLFETEIEQEKTCDRKIIWLYRAESPPCFFLAYLDNLSQLMLRPLSM
jgi:hypothetical protein